jgi:tRNASer (uridine44-2'-O)-methyltransferase
MINIRGQFPPLVFIKNALSYCTSRGDTPPKVLYKYLIRQCERLPDGPKNHYKFMIKQVSCGTFYTFGARSLPQSFKQHVKETDPERIKQIVARSYEDADWILKKVNFEFRADCYLKTLFFSTTRNSRMDRIPLVTSSTTFPLRNFWNSVMVYHDRPNVVNRKLAAVAPVLLCEISLHSPRIKRLSEIFTREALLYEIRKLPNLQMITPQFIREITESYDKNASIKECDREVFERSLEGQFVSLRILLPRGDQKKCLELVIFDRTAKSATFFAVQEQSEHIAAPRFPYHIELTPRDNLRIVLDTFEDADTSSAEWLADKLFPKLLKWTEDVQDKAVTSLSLVLPNEYCTLYAELKAKYGQNLVKAWPQKANTDPQKYVYEDVAIAAYLICLWRRLGAENINFVDCGCGNGLLVYVLNEEGYRGCGFDIRGRKTWDLYEGRADLREGTITPESTFPEATWIIGNHSDELTPWIPIVALKSSPKTNFFVLPCCSYELSGRKYVRMNSAISQYEDYLDYVRNISVLCGFTTSVDKLRIPSTKRTCLVGVRGDASDVDEIQRRVSAFVGQRQNCEFVARESVEAVRNCTRLNRDLIKTIVGLVVEQLLKAECTIGKGDGQAWNRGGTLRLGELSQKIPAEDRKPLKNECGGLQTLLKNHRYIFNVKNGEVSLRPPPSLNECNKYEDKPCWFHANHPDGCLFRSETCAYKHVENL